jgi:phosphoserine phosphatase
MKFNTFFFDCDSTLLNVETLDLLAQQKGVGKRVKELTTRSMNGEMSLKVAMKEKMALIAPSLHEITKLYQDIDRLFTPGARKLVYTLQKQGHRVCILTNNYTPIVASCC